MRVLSEDETAEMLGISPDAGNGSQSGSTGKSNPKRTEICRVRSVGLYRTLTSAVSILVADVTSQFPFESDLFHPALFAILVPGPIGRDVVFIAKAKHYFIHVPAIT
jgi:hypothetical protein